MRRSAGAILLVLHALATLACGGRDATRPAATTTPSPAPDILIVTLDTTRADRIGAYGWPQPLTPHVDRLSRRSAVFADAVTPVPLTLPAHASLMTGRPPAEHGVRDNGIHRLSGEATTIAERLAAEGYRTAAFVSGMPLEHPFGLAQGFSVYADTSAEGGQVAVEELRLTERPAAATTALAVSWLEAPAEAAPRFVWVHYYDPHDPYVPVPPFGIHGSYEGEIASADHAFGRLSAAFRPDTGDVVVVAADHGESLHEHGELTHGHRVTEAAIRIPLVAQLGRAAPSIETRPASLTDVAAWIGRLRAWPDAGLPPSDADERLLPIETYAPLHSFGWSPPRGLRTARFKYVHLPTPELYWIDVDPGERVNAAPEADASLLAQLAARVPGIASSTSEEVVLDDETRRRLEALGYVGAAAGPIALDELPDPKDRRFELMAMQEAEALLRDGEAEAAWGRVAAVLGGDPGNPRAHHLAAAALRERGRIAEARRLVDARLRARPDDEVALRQAVLLARRAGCPDEALALHDRFATHREPSLDDRFQRALLLDEMGLSRAARAALREVAEGGYVAAWNQLGLMEMAHDAESAVEALSKAVHGQPGNATYRQNLASALLAHGDKAAAREQLVAVARLRPDDGETCLGIAVLSLELGDIEAGDRYLAQALARPGSRNPEQVRERYARLRARATGEARPR